eukprot:1450680-Rhodomonas_salina.1
MTRKRRSDSKPAVPDARHSSFRQISLWDSVCSNVGGARQVRVLRARDEEERAATRLGEGRAERRGGRAHDELEVAGLDRRGLVNDVRRRRELGHAVQARVVLQREHPDGARLAGRVLVANGAHERCARADQARRRVRVHDVEERLPLEEPRPGRRADLVAFAPDSVVVPRRHVQDARELRIRLHDRPVLRVDARHAAHLRRQQRLAVPPCGFVLRACGAALLCRADHAPPAPRPGVGHRSAAIGAVHGADLRNHVAKERVEVPLGTILYARRHQARQLNLARFFQIPIALLLHSPDSHVP